MTNYLIYELPCYDGRKSFYGKAHVIHHGAWRYLRSYDTIVCSVDAQGRFHRFWGGYSMTTMRHVNSFRYSCGLPTLTKAEWEALDVE